MDIFKMPYQVKTLKEAVLKTLSFFDVFDHPLTLEELHRYLLHFYTDEERIQMYLKISGIIDSRDGYYFFRDRSDLPFLRQQSEIYSQKLWKRIGRFAFILRMVPFVQMVAVCNNLAFSKASEQSDIDLFVVTSKNRLFLARTFFVSFLGIFGIRLHSNKKMPGKFCLSFLVSEDAVDLSDIQEKPYDIYLAYWIATLKPLLGYHMYENFLRKNEWVKKFFPRGVFPQTDSFLPEHSFMKRILEKILGGRFGDYCEKKLANWQLRRALDKYEKMRKPGGIIIRENILKFHHQDRRTAIREAWEERIRNFSF